MHRRWLRIFGALALLAAAACNTMEGVGRDVESTGEGISDTAQDVKQRL